MPRLGLFVAALTIGLLAGCAATPPAPPAPAVAADTTEADARALPSIEETTAGMDRRDGLFPLYWDASTGHVWLEIPAMDEDFLYAHGLSAGLGSNDVGPDRSQLGGERIVRFERVGPKVLLVQPNLRYRATTDNPAEALAVRDAFAESIEWGFTAVAETDGRVLVDATAFIVRDVHGIARTLRQTRQGTFRLDPARSAPVPTMLKAFPRNTEMEARLTFASDAPGRFVRDVAADPYAPTVRVRHSFIALPEPGYEPRAFDPRSGYFPLNYADYATPIGEPTTQRLITRHRLECAAPPDASGMCDAKEPIVYYLDPGTPEPVRSALLDGARWWTEAFEAAGFRDGYRVEVRPDSIDPMDARYSTIQWVHRATRGWSYGASIVDPRTGEILKGHVSLGSLRVRQDYLLAEGLLSPYTGDARLGDDDPMLEMALARIRQLSAHEVGHTIGIAHNFAASTDGRASVMDYPAPLATLTEAGTVDLSDAYGVGIGAWDIQAVKYGYTPDASALPGILQETLDLGLGYITDYDSRPPGAATPTGHLWDNGTDAVQALRDAMAVRRSALDRFGEAAIRDGRPMAQLEEVLVPLFLHHRYQVEATAKLVGGVHYAYTLRGDGQPPPEPVAAEAQRAALEALLATLDPSELALPEAVVGMIPPRPPGYYDTRERFDRRTGVALDPVAPAETAAQLVVGLLLNPERAARLVYQHDRDPDLPSFAEVLERSTSAIGGLQAEGTVEAEIVRAILTAWVQGLLSLAADTDAAPPVRARAQNALVGIGGALAGAQPTNEDGVHAQWLAGEIRRFVSREYEADERPEPLRTPPGSPIGH
ncbi:MAG: zinc-dependent metalloprotease [Bacteroidota bacterium]